MKFTDATVRKLAVPAGKAEAIFFDDEIPGFGLRLRAVGENPESARMAGIGPGPLRFAAVTLSGVLAALAGTFLSLGDSHTFSRDMSAGKGYIALAAVIFGKWNPLGAFGGCLLFGFGQALYANIQNNSSALTDYSALIATIPYLLTIVALAGFVGRAVPPAADGIPPRAPVAVFSVTPAGKPPLLIDHT